jgi:hypothetical protein
LLLCVASPALFETLRYGQLSAITTALFLGAATLDRRGWPVAAGVCLGLVAYKPNLVLPAAVVWVIVREWRLLAGLIIGVSVHLTLGLLAAKVEVTLMWLATLLALARDPSLVQGFPHEVHSLRGFWRLTGLDVSALGWLTAASTIIVLGLTVWIWRRTTDRNPRWAAVVLATLLVSPHLLTYDLLLLAVPLLLVADTSLRTKPRAAWWKLLLVSLYFGPLVSPLVARLSGVQVSTVAMAWLLGLLSVQLAEGRAGARLVRAGVPEPG